MRSVVKGVTVFLICLSVGVLVWTVPLFFPKQSTTVLERSEFQRGPQKIVVTAYAEKNSFVPGAYYSFEVSSGSTKKPILTFRHDDPVPINKKGVVFLSDQVAYVFMGWKYAVTTDAGETWHIWTAEQDLPGWRCCNYGLIKEVDLSADGTGKMILDPLSKSAGERSELYTTDFGKHWSVDNSLVQSTP